MNRLRKTSGLLVMLSLLSMSACVSKPVPSVPATAATTQCKTDCVSVSKAFVKRHAELFDENIRLKAKVKLLEAKP